MTTKTKSRSVSTPARLVSKTKSRTPAPPVAAANTKARPATSFTERESLAELLLTPPATLDDYLIRIRALGERVRGCVQFMCAVEKMNGTCAEAKQRSVAQFYDRLVMLDRELCRIQEELQLG
jgi:hypothetical protein